MIKTISVLLILFAGIMPGQNKGLNTDSLFQLYTGLKDQISLESVSPEDQKCAFGLVSRVRANFDRFTPEQQQILKKLFDRIPRTHSLISPSGRFRIHYNAIGDEAPGYLSNLTAEENAMLIGEAADSSFNFECSYLGYPPPSDNGAGGDNRYDIYIINTPSSLYGYTEFEDEVTPGSGTFTSFMVIDQDYSGFYSSGINGARVTIAHELHHGVQMGNYIYRDPDLYYYELSSTAMEEFVFDSVNDYYAYMGGTSGYFQNTEKSITRQNGYNLAVFNIFLEKRFDHNLLKRIWELMPADTALNAINRALLERGSSFQEEFGKFATWIFFTNHRAEEQYFEEGANYPLVRPLQIISFSPPDENVAASSKPTGNTYLFFINGIDTLAVVVSNGDIRSTLNNPDIDQPYNYNLYDHESPGSVKLTDNYFRTFTTAKPNFWQTTEILNNLVIKDGFIDEITADFPFPAPFYYSRSYQTGSSIFIPIQNVTSGTVELTVFTTGMELVYSDPYQPVVSKIKESRIRAVEWDLGSRERLATGVYIYVIKSGEDVIKGKLLIFND